MKRMKRGFAIFLAMVLLSGSWMVSAGKAYAAGALLSEGRTDETGETKENAETEADIEKKDSEADTSSEESESTEESESIRETESENGTEDIEETDAEDTESTEESESTEETEASGESGDVNETESTEETGVVEESAAFYEAVSPTVTYGVHMQSYGWLEDGINNSPCGKPESGKRLEAVKIQVSGIAGLGIDYQVYSDGKGWLSGKDGTAAGTTGEARKVEALKVSLSGVAASQYEIYYRVYVQGYGWLDWAKDGGISGVGSSWNRMVEAVQIKIQARGSLAPGPVARPYLETDPDDGYANPHVNTGNRIYDIIAVAKTQVGYYKAEGTPTKYGTWYGANIANGSAYASAAWCAMFVSWCADQAGVPSNVFYRHSYTESMVVWYKNGKNPGYWYEKGSYTPKAGDLIFFKFSDNPNRKVDHVGLVSEVSGGTVYTIEGNSSDSVRERSYLLNNRYIVGYAVPDYNETGITAPPPEDEQIAYRADVEGKGWDVWTGDGKMAGTTGSYKMLRALIVKLSDQIPGGVTYRTHMQTAGWQDWVSDGEVSGIPDGTKRMEAVEIRLTGEAEKKYDIYYHVHSQSFGWLDWAKNGESAGSEGYAKRVEAIEICMVPKGGAAPGSTARPFVKMTADQPADKPASVSYSTHCQTYGWLTATADGVMNGTTGKAKRLEGIKINLSNVSGDISYRTHVQTYGWQGWVKNGALSGTTGEAKRLEAIEISLLGEAASKYDIYYRVHCQTYGWMGWAKNGEPAGSSGLAKRLEAIEIRLVPKGGAAPGSTAQHYVTN